MLRLTIQEFPLENLSAGKNATGWITGRRTLTAPLMINASILKHTF